MDRAEDQYEEFQQEELRAFLTNRLAEVSLRFGADSETARLYRERLEELEGGPIVEEISLVRA